MLTDYTTNRPINMVTSINPLFKLCGGIKIHTKLFKHRAAHYSNTLERLDTYLFKENINSIPVITTILYQKYMNNLINENRYT